MTNNLHISSSLDELSIALADYVFIIASHAITTRGFFTIALSGGSLTRFLAEGLLAQPLRDQIEWTAWNVFWVDERWVPVDSPESNSGTTHRELLHQVNISQNQIHALDVSLTPNEAAMAYQSTLAEVFNCRDAQVPAFDLILLGIGEDGHTASLFPNHKLLNEEELWVAPIFDSPKPPANRITFTLPLINNAHNLAFVAAGGNKAGVISEILDEDLNESTLPAGLVRLTDGQISWFLDKAASAKL